MKNISKIIIKNREVSAIIIVLLILGVILLTTPDILNLPKKVNTLSLSYPDGMKLEIETFVDKLGSTKLKPLLITPQDAQIKTGEVLQFTDMTEIWETCSKLEVIWTLKSPLPRGGIIDSDVITFGYSAPQSLVTTYKVTAGSTIGEHRIETNFRCNGIAIGRDGCAKLTTQCSDTTAGPWSTTFTVFDNSLPPPPPPPGLCWIYNGISKVCESINVNKGSQTCSEYSPTYYDSKEVCLNKNPPPPPPGSKQCSDNIDNDEDNLIDLNDPGCENTEDDDETNEEKKLDIKTILIILGIVLIGSGIYLQNRRK